MTNMDRGSSEAEDRLPALHTNSADLKDADITMLSDEEPGHVYTPPAHIAARFYRSNNNRRRSSAASSRRNSLSSTHSHHSNRSYRGIHSTHVAQHLRRASIIETRKARLADRAAHAEEVRLRAALAKAAPRTSVLEEKALAAQQARDRLLAKVVAACAEEVARAKKIAEETREKKAADERRCRLELEEKHAEAERRRLEYKRTARKGRSTSTAAVDGKRHIESRSDHLSHERAAMLIQRVWKDRIHMTRISSFRKLGLTTDRIRGLDFMDASTLLADSSVIMETRAIMRHLKLDLSADVDRTVVRRFLSAYMILGHATDVFNNPEQQAEDLVEKARELLISFETILDIASGSSRPRTSTTQSQALSQSYAAYLAAFEAWKSKDASVLIDTMVAQFVAFDAIWQTVKDDTRGEVANDYRDAIREQQIILLSKIKKLAGADSANRRIKEAIRESRRARLQHRRPIGDLRPRPAIFPEVPAPNNTPGHVQVQTASNGDDDEADSPYPSQDEVSRIFSVVPPNRELVHELMIDPQFRIEVSAKSDVRSVLNREVCDSMRQAVHEGRGDTWTIAVAANIRKRLLKLLKPGTPMHNVLSEVLDPVHVRNQCEQGLFSYEKFFLFIADLLPKLCAPFRDAEIKALADVLKRSGDNADAMIEKLFGLLHVIDLMSLDYTNFLLQQSAPTLIREGPTYEERVFARDLESDRHTLRRTRRWWRHATVSLLTDPNVTNQPFPSANVEPTLARAQSSAFPRIYSRGLTDLLFASQPIESYDVPETLQYDTARLSRIRADLARYITAGAILLTAKNLLRRDVRSQWKPEARRVFDALGAAGNVSDSPDAATTLVTRICAIIEAAHGMPASSRTHLERTTGRFIREAANGRSATEAVLKLLTQRLRTCLFAQLVAACSQGVSSTERVRMASSSSEALGGVGLAEFVPGIGACVDETIKIAEVDLRSHGRWYTDVARELEDQGGAD